MINKQDAFVFIHTHRDEFPVVTLLKMLGVSSSGYYDWVKRGGVYARLDRDEEMYQYILKVFKQSKGTLGRRRVKLALKNEFGLELSEKRIARIMRSYGLKCKIRKKFKKQKDEVPHYVENILERQFEAKEPGRKFCMDITYVKVLHPAEHWAYLCAITDLYNNEIVAFTFSQAQNLRMVFNTVNQLHEKGFAKNAILHTDQGIQFTNPQYLHHIRNIGLIPSMSRRGNCWDNACIESFFSHFKVEIDHFGDAKTYQQIELLIDEYMTYYNTQRPQQKLGTTPSGYRLNAA